MLERFRYWAANQAGPFFLGTLAVTGVFARGLANLAYGLLALWALAVWLRRAWRRGNNGAESSSSAEALSWPPGRWAGGLAIFTLTWLAALAAGEHYAVGFKYLGVLIYLLVLPLAVWPVFSRFPWLPARLKFFWGLGLMVAAALTFHEAGFRPLCIRAKAHLGAIELGSILGQLIPLMTGALLQALLAGRRWASAFFALALASAGFALIQNCSRQTFLAAPVLALTMIWAYRRQLRRRPGLCLAVLTLIILVGGAAFFSTGGSRRFTDMAGNSALGGSALLFPNQSENARLTAWSDGWKIFQAQPLLGVGPGAFPQAQNRLEPAIFKPNAHAHQLFIQVLAETGWVGFMGFLALHLAPLSLLWPHRHSPDSETFFWVWAALAVNLQFLLNGLTDQVFGLKPMMYIHWLTTAAALWLTARRPAGQVVLP